MSVVATLLDTYPRDLGKVDRDRLVACIEACIACAGVHGVRGCRPGRGRRRRAPKVHPQLSRLR
jgi:hypothetical protein